MPGYGTASWPTGGPSGLVGLSIAQIRRSRGPHPALFSVCCALVGDIRLLIVLRVLQGLAGTAAAVTAMAVVRDGLVTRDSPLPLALIMLGTSAVGLAAYLLVRPTLHRYLD